MRACRSLSEEQMDSSFRWMTVSPPRALMARIPAFAGMTASLPGMTDNKPGFGAGLGPRLLPG